MPAAALKLVLEEDAAAAALEALEAPAEAALAAELVADTKFEERLATALDALDAALPVTADVPDDGLLRRIHFSTALQ